MLKQHVFQVCGMKSALACFLAILWTAASFSPVLSETEAGEPRRIALVMKALSNPFFSKMEEGARAYARKHRLVLDVFGLERETEVQRQINVVENLISGKYEAIIIAPVDSKKLAPVCHKAVKEGIVVINIDNPLHRSALEEADASIPFVGPDNQAGAALVGDYFRRRMQGSGRAILIEGIRGVENAEQRKKGFMKGLQRDGAVEIVASESANWHTDEAFSLATRLLKDVGPVDAILCANDKMALGVLKALDLMGLQRSVLVAGYDNIEAARYEMQKGRMHATVEQHPELMGELGVDLAVQALNGETVPRQVTTRVDLITHETFGKKIGFCVSDLSNPFFTSLIEGARRTSALFGATLAVADAHNDDAQQLSDIMSFLKQQVDVLIINPTNTETVTPGIELANDKSIPVITVDRRASGGDILCHIESDNVEGGRIAAKVLMDHLGRKGKVVEIEGIPGTSVARERSKGFNEVLRAYSHVEVIVREGAHFSRARAFEVMKSLLDRQIAFDAVFAHNDNMILGVLDALEKVQPEESKVLIGFDGLEEAVKAVEEGRITATIAQNPIEMGALAVQSTARFFRGQPLQRVIPVGLKLIER